MTTTTITETTGLGHNNIGQHNDLTGIYRVDRPGSRPGSHKLRVVIHVDPIYRNQSNARCEVWSETDNRWNLISHLLPDYIGTAAGNQIMEGYRSELISVALEVLA